MKTVSIIANVLAASALIFASVSCNEKEEPQATKKMEVTAEPSYNVAAQDAKAVSFDISSNTPWEISNDAEEWIHLSGNSSATESLMATITVTFDDNDRTEPRTGKLTVSGEGVQPVEILFTQTVPGAITVNQNLETFTMNGGTQTFTIVSNKSWEVYADKTWLSFSPSSGTASAEPVTVTVTATGNGGRGETAVITVASTEDGTTQTFEVSIDGVKLQLGTFEEESKMFQAEGGALECTVDANIEWKVVLEPQDTKVTATEAEGKFIINVPFNDIFAARDVTVKVLPENESYNEIIDAQEFVISQKSIITTEALDKITATVNEDGTVSFSGEGNIDAQTAKLYKCGKYIFNVENLELTEDAFLTIIGQNWYENLNPALQCKFEYRENFFKYFIGGNVNAANSDAGEGWFFGKRWGQSETFTENIPSVSDAKSFTIDIAPKEGAEQFCVVSFYINDTLIKSYERQDGKDQWTYCNNCYNPWWSGLDNPRGPLEVIIRIAQGSGQGTMTLKSFEYIPY